VSFLGMVRVDGDLDPETGETLLTALRAVLDAEARSRGRDDLRTPAQRRADALGEICRQRLDLADRPTVAGERPHVTVTVAQDALSEPREESIAGDRSPSHGGSELVGMLGRTSELDHTGPISLEAARRLACDASIRRVVMAGSGAA
jgi:hypothetical protein